MSAVYCSTLRGNNPDLNQGIVLLLVSHFCQHHELVSDDMSLNVANKARHHLIVSLETADVFKLFLRIIASLENQIAVQVSRFHRR